MASKSEYILKVHITASAEKAEGVLDVIVWMLTHPREDDPSPKGFGMPGVTFEGAFMEEVDEDGNSIPCDTSDRRG